MSQAQSRASLLLGFIVFGFSTEIAVMIGILEGLS